MQKWKLGRYLRPILFAVFAVVGTAGSAFATTSTSPNYQVTETQFGSSQESCSGQYCARASIGDPTSGTPTGNSTAEFQTIPDNEPTLEVIIEAGASNLGVLTTETTATKITTIRVRNYLSGGYVLQIIGSPPKFGDHTLATSGQPTASRPGTEQFGINAVANTSPNVGVNPVQVPEGATIFGAVNDNYSIPNLFKYTSEDVIGRGLTDTGRTDYTVSMIVNISNSTPAGHYTGDFAAVVIPAY